MRTRQALIAVSFIMLALCAITRVASALPPLPSSFYGTAKIDGNNVPAGTFVTAWINGVKYAETTVMTYDGNTVYSISVPGDDSSTPGLIEGGTPGDTVIFFIGNAAARQTGIWQTGTNVSLDLSRTTSSAPNSIVIQVEPAELIVDSNAVAVITATVRNSSNQPVAGVVLSGSTIPTTLGAVSLPLATDAAGQTVGAWTAGTLADLGSLGVGTATLSCTVPITLNNPRPSIIDLSPMTVTVNTPSLTLTVTGTHFVASSLIRLNGISHSTAFRTDTRLQTLIDSTELTATGLITVAAYNSTPGGGESNALAIIIVPANKLVYLPVIERHNTALDQALLPIFYWLQRLVLSRWP